MNKLDNFSPHFRDYMRKKLIDFMHGGKVIHFSKKYFNKAKSVFIDEWNKNEKLEMDRDIYKMKFGKNKMFIFEKKKDFVTGMLFKKTIDLRLKIMVLESEYLLKDYV
jgi:hypothetical protein